MSRDFQYYSDGLLWKTVVNSVEGGQATNTAFYRDLSYDAFRDDVAGAMFKNGEAIQEEHSYSRPSQSYKTNHFGDIAGGLRVSHEISDRTTTLGVYDGSSYNDVLTSERSAHSVRREYDNVMTHGGGYQSVTEAYDAYGFPTSVSCGGLEMATFSYGENFASRYCSLLAGVADAFSGRDVSIAYRGRGEVSSVQVGGFSVSYSEDPDGVSCAEYSFGPNEPYACKSSPDQAFALAGQSTVAASLWSYTHDGLGRVSSKYDGAVPFGLTQSYSYSNDQPFRASGYSFGGSYSESYSYGDGYGNVTGVSASSQGLSYSSSYQFDGLGRIVSETNSKLGISRSYHYEAIGDHASGPVGRMAYFGNAQMRYDEKGRLSQFGSVFYSYDHYGNRASRNQVSYQWDRGTLLSYCGFSRFEYDYRGIRSLKVDPSGWSHEYFYDGGRLVGEDVKNGSATVRKLRFFYDLDGLCALRVIEGNATNDYIYVRNPFGDIVGLAEGSTIKALYVYDAWGNHKVYNPDGTENASSTFVGNINPFRYRGYYFDPETGLYYLKSRYYDPEIGQFISPDDVGYMDFEAIGGLNLYAYCNYNPVMHSDPDGHSVLAVGLVLLGFGIGAALGAGASLITQGLTKGWDKINGWQVLFDAGIGGISGAFSFSGIGAWGMAFVSGVLGIAGSVGGDLIANKGDWFSVNWIKAFVMGGVNFAIGRIVGAGVQNKKEIGNILQKVSSNYRAVLTAATRYGTGSGFRNTWNLYGERLLADIAMAMPCIIAGRSFLATSTMVSTSFATTMFNLGADFWFGWW